MIISRLGLVNRSLARPPTTLVGSGNTTGALTQLLNGMQLSPINNTTARFQQQRFRWTKAKKKRYARYQRRQELAAAGKSLNKPPYYFPRDTPVVNALDVATRKADIEAQDAADSEKLKARRQKLQEQDKGSLLRFHVTTGANKISDRVRKLLDLHNGNQAQVVQAQKHRGMKLFQLREGDTGSSAVQVIALTSRIQQMQMHMMEHKKDKHSKRGMDALYVRRRKLLNYMERKDFEAYRRVVKTLGLMRH